VTLAKTGDPKIGEMSNRSNFGEYSDESNQASTSLDAHPCHPANFQPGASLLIAQLKVMAQGV
jgi:hypothetical protein